MAVYLNDNYHAAELTVEDSPYHHSIVSPEEGMDANFAVFVKDCYSAGGSDDPPNYAELNGGYIYFELERTMPTGMIALDTEARSLLEVDVGDTETVLFLKEHPIL